MKRGATLISTLVGIALLAATVAGTVHVCTLAGMAVSLADSRTTALMIAETRIETLLVKGYEALPSIGLHKIDGATIDRLPNAAGVVSISKGPQPESRTITVRIKWQQRHDRQVSTLTLSRIMVGDGTVADVSGGGGEAR
jgi:hypothetical protein